jgi:hypothetical protein
MRLSCFYNLIFVLVFFNSSVVARNIPIHLRDAPSTGSSAIPSAAASSTIAGNGAASTGPAVSTSVPVTSFTPSNVSSHSTLAATTVPSASPSTMANSSMALLSIDDGSLPMPPEITPALSVAGTLLMISGTVYCLIGIKSRWLQIFISTAYLIALAITVLILYVINPPISNAIQGAYFVAAFIPAVGLGGLALIFKDMVEGFGCAVGGFALSMFFLVLKEGGLLTSTAAKAIFIGCWTAGIYALYFSRHIRSYVLIVSTSLAGSTTVILGIDCFSLAGLKEFWVYIWALNGKLFPPMQDTYPITRGMRVEIAGIIIFAFFGIMSQIRIWKIVQSRREKKELEKTEEERRRDELEEELGRALEAGQAQERLQWERIYGEKQVDSAIGTEANSEHKRSASFSVHEVANLSAQNKSANVTVTSRRSSVESKKPGQPVVVQVDPDDITPLPSDETQNLTPLWQSNPASSAATSIIEPEDDKIETQRLHPGPEIIPLPFRIPLQEESPDDIDSVAASVLTPSLGNRSSLNLGRPSLLRTLSNKMKRLSMVSSTSVEAMADETASNRNRDSYFGALSSEEPQPIALTEMGSSSEILKDHVDEQIIQDPEPSIQADHVEKSLHDGSQFWPLKSESEKRDSIDSRISRRSSIQQSHVDGGSITETHLPSDVAIQPVDSSYESEKEKPMANTKTTEEQSREIFAEEKPSRVVLQFRTNEWAKHLENAEKPTPDDLLSSENIVEEPVSIVNEKELLQTPLTAQPAPAAVSRKEMNVKKTRSSTSQSSKERGPVRIPSLIIDDVSTGQRALVVRNSSSSSSLASNRSSPMRTDSNRRPHFPSIRTSTNSLLASPIAEDAVASFASNPSPGLRNKGQQRSSVPYRSNTDPTLNKQAPYHRSSPTPRDVSGSSYEDAAAALSNDNLPLSKRKSYLRQNGSPSQENQPSPDNLGSHQSGSSRQPNRQQTYPPPQGRQYNVPDHTIQRAAMLAEWRKSKALEQDSQVLQNRTSTSSLKQIPSYTPPDQGPNSAKGRVQSMGPGASWGSYSPLGGTGMTFTGNVGSKGMIDSAIYGREGGRRASVMSAREVDTAHREVLRRMQAGANRALHQHGS